MPVGYPHGASLSPSTSPKTSTKISSRPSSDVLNSINSDARHDQAHLAGIMGRVSSGHLSPHISVHRPKFLKPKRGFLQKLRSHDSKKKPSVTSNSSVDDTLRHAEVDSPTLVRQDTSQKKSLVRVFRDSGTFGTLACPVDATATEMVKLATRKFFISDPENYRLKFQRPDRPRYFKPDDLPIKTLHSLAERLGYAHSGREDLSFLGRFILHRKESVKELNATLPARPENIRLVDFVEDDFPPHLLAQGSKIERVEMYQSSITALQKLAPIAPNIKIVRLRDCVLSQPVLPHGLVEFQQLQTLDLRRNALTELTIDFSKLPNLKALDISGNCLCELPKTLASCPLQSLFASTNKLTTFDSFTPTLEELNIDYNLISSFGPTIACAAALTRVYAAYNNFTRLPSQLEFVETLKVLDISGNYISHLGQTRSLSVTTLKMGHNISAKEETPHRAREVKAPYFYLPNLLVADIGMNGRNFVQTPYCPLLTVLNIQGQNLTTISDTFMSTLPNITSLDLSSNQLNSLPGTLGNCRQLQKLNLANNSLIHLPPELTLLENLTALEVQCNNLKSLPAYFFRLASLRTLNLSSNLFESLEFLDNQQSLESRRNSTTSWSTNSGSDIVPLSDHFQLGTLENLIMADNRLNDDSLEALGNMPHLRTLNLSYNDLSEIPNGVISKLTELRRIYLSGNRITTLPHEELDGLVHLREVYLNGNRLHTISAEFSKLERLEVLDVSDNNLHYNVCNWPFDWNWRWNKQLRYLNFSCNRRLEIKRTERSRQEDLTDFSVLPNLTVLGLMDVTVLHPSVPDQSEDCRIRSYGSDLTRFKFGIADALGDDPLGINDIVIDHFRDIQEELLIGIFDGQQKYTDHGNRVSKIFQELFPQAFRTELELNGKDIQGAMLRTLKNLHAEVGNVAVLKEHEIPHTKLGQNNHVALRFDDRDKLSGTGAALCYMRGNVAHIAAIGGTQCIVSRADGNFKLLNTPHKTSVRSELDHARNTGAIIVDGKINDLTEYTRLLGCYTLGDSLQRTPFYTEYTLNSSDILVMACAEFWEHIDFATAADIVRGEAGDSTAAALKLRDLAIAYGCKSRLMVTVLTAQQAHDREFKSKRKQVLPQDSLLARLGSEVAPPLGDVTLVFTDIRHSTYLWETMPNVMRAAIKTHNSIMRRSIRLMSGYEVKTEGDAFIVAFNSPVEALLWCLTVQQQLLIAEWPPTLLDHEEGSPIYENETLVFQGLRVRMGIHRGRPVCEQDPITGRMDYFGPMVNKAARISGVANGGQITISRNLLEIISKSDDDPNTSRMLQEMGFVSVDVGELKLKGIENPEHIVTVYPAPLKHRATHNWNDEHGVSAQPIERPPAGIHQNSLSSIWSNGRQPSFEVGVMPRVSTAEDWHVAHILGVVQRLENLCAFIKTGLYRRDLIPEVSMLPIDSEELLDTIITRLENATTTLAVGLASSPDIEISQLVELLKNF